MSAIHETIARRIIFGAGSLASLPSELAGLGLRRPLVIAGRSQASHAERLLSAVGGGGSIIGVRVHVPAALAEDARARALELEADCLVSIGGGSAVGLAKAVALTEGLPIAAVPTTYAGSELTVVWGMTEDGRKTTGRDPSVAPRLVVYDPELTYDLPAGVTAASGMNAVAHCVEALWSPGATPVTDAAAERRAAPPRGGHPRLAAGPARPGCACHRARRRLARGGGVRGRRRAAPQALPPARRHVRPAPRGVARRPPAVHLRLPAAGGARGRTAHRGGARRRPTPPRRSPRWRETSVRHDRSRHSA